ncbi:hypothetical protein O7631_30940 [Micromonospora sp. WMMD967]|uniref:hypothetical protein n=1 Tax=Micromonospora sp. WMMD967 TaxID=3016101 RepID=UPI0024174080|nr:hypothetical protein [Micromonospora sp. WMMD967]MDG4840964.1 hypothetical protein [Micromonospora sp. WMMD967]
MIGDDAGRFVVHADRDGELTHEHWSPEGFRATDPWCWWEIASTRARQIMAQTQRIVNGQSDGVVNHLRRRGR